MKRALITGITGQDGQNLAELLLEKGYEVHGIIRRASTFNTSRIDHIFDKLKLYHGDITDSNSIIKVLDQSQPDMIFNLAAQSHVRVSFDEPIYTADTIAMGTARLLEGIRQTLDIKKVRFYQASSSEQFGSSPPLQNENTPFKPRSPYACAKVHAHYLTIHYKEAYGLFACCGILFNHEGISRGETFVTRKISRSATRIKLGLQDKLHLGNLDAKRDWGESSNYVESMYLMLQQDEPDDYVIATGETHSVKEFLEETFNYLGLDWHTYVEIDERLKRPTEVNVLQGDSSKARFKLGWVPKTSFKQLVHKMVDHDLKLAKNERLVKDNADGGQ
jgi:GDPmannose 4,6-dehydratase